MEEKIPQISVIIPMYNAEKYIEQCLNSVVAQTFEDYEVIVIDDCSTDRSVEIVENIVHTTHTHTRGVRRSESSSCLKTPEEPHFLATWGFDSQSASMSPSSTATI